MAEGSADLAVAGFGGGAPRAAVDVGGVLGGGGALRVYGGAFSPETFFRAGFVGAGLLHVGVRRDVGCCSAD